MAVGDIYYAKFNFSTENCPFSFGFYLREETNLAPVDDGGAVARAVNAHFGTAILAILSDQGFFESVQCHRRTPASSRPGYVIRQGSAGLLTGDPMPNSNCIFINLRQEAQDAKFNGGIYMGGQSDANHTGNEWGSTYLSTQVKAFTDLIPAVINAVGPDVGTWQVQVLSKTFVPPSTPIGTPFLVTSATATSRVMSQRRRTSKIRGWQLATA